MNMKTAEIDFSAPVAILKKSITNPWRDANVYKVKYYASFVIMYHGNPDIIYCGDPGQVARYAEKEGLSLIPMNSRGRKFFHYTINR